MSKVYSVKQINTYVKNMFSQDFLLSKVSVQGEISNLKDHPTGHLYFTLKDRDAQLSAVMFAGNRRGLRCRLREGMEIVATGEVNIYEAAGKYQLYVREITEAGVGDLYQKFLNLKKELQEMGMFDAAYKKPLPKYAKTVGIVTASSGAALHDIMQISERRNPYVQLILSPAQVQGEDAPESIVSAIKRLDSLHPDVMIVGRGGGSIEDLWAFNDERVARAIFDADTPVISAVGHETDFTIADFVADHRAPTPSAAAELAVFDDAQYQNELRSAYDRMERIMKVKTENLKAALQKKTLELRLRHPERKLEDQRRKLETLKEHLYRTLEEELLKKKQALSILAERLQGRSPLEKLKGGYGYIETGNGALRSASQVKSGDTLTITLHDGTVKGHVD